MSPRWLHWPASWTPSELPHLRVWLDADDTGFANNESVDSWTNKGTGGNAVQSIPDRRPVFRTDILNGKPSVRYDGINDCLQAPALALDTYISVFMVARTSTTGPFFVEHGPNVNSEPGFSFYGKGGSGSAYYRVRRGTTQNSYLGTVDWLGSSAAQAALVINAITSTPNPMGKVYKDGTVQADGAAGIATDSVSNASVATTLNIGARNNGEVVPMDGDLHELLIYNAPLSQADREKVEGYLAWKWGLEANLPSTHPYRNSAP